MKERRVHCINDIVAKSYGTIFVFSFIYLLKSRLL